MNDPSSLPKPHLLVVDDEVSMCEFLQIMLKKQGYHVITASSGDQALQFLEKEIFDLVITDLSMPEMSGMDFFAELGRTAPALVSRVVFLTGGAFTAGAAEFLGRLKNPCLDKPVELKKLIGTIEEQLT